MKQSIKTVKLPQEIRTSQFLKFVRLYAKQFKANNGYGKWLAEYQEMDKLYWFDTPTILRDIYIDILLNNSTQPYIIRDAAYYICTQALEATRALLSQRLFAICLITGEIALDDNDNELTGLSFENATTLCKTMNDEAEEILFRVTLQ